MAKLKYSISLLTTEKERVDKLKVKLMSAGDFTVVVHKELSIDSGVGADLVVVDVTKIDRKLMDFLDSVYNVKEADATLGTSEFDVEVCFLDTKKLLRDEVARSPYYCLNHTFVYDSLDDIIELIRRRFIERLF